MINNFPVKSVSMLLIVSIIFAVIHFFLIENVLPEVYGSGPYWAIYLFLVPMSLMVIVISQLQYNKDKTAVGKTFFIFVFFKIFGSIAFLSPWLFWKDDFSIPLVQQFFCLFFPLLYVEIVALIKLLNNPFNESAKYDENQ